MSRQSFADRPHVLIVTAIGDGLEPEVEWRIVHPPTCQWEAWRRGLDAFLHDEPGTDPDELLFHRACLTQYETENVGVDDVEGWPLTPGRYRLFCESIYHPGEFGGTYGEEWDVAMHAEPLDAADA